MSKLSIYEASWINLVFENKNKEYGAYQLRLNSSKTSLFALFMGLLLCAALMTIPKVLTLFSTNSVPTTEIIDPVERIIQISTVVPPVLKPIEKQIAVKPIVQKPTEASVKKQLANPTIVKAPLATPDIATNIESSTIKQTTNDGNGITGLNPTPAQGNNTENGSAVDYGTTVVNSAILDKLPEFPGGIAKFYNYIGKNFESPEINGDRNIRVFVSFVVEKDGSMTDIQVKNNPGYGLDKEAIRVLKSLKTKWTPGMIGSKPVRTSYNLPITVQMH
jgi:protein TonB